MEPTECGDPVSGIGCVTRGCTHDNPADPNVAAYVAAGERPHDAPTP